MIIVVAPSAYSLLPELLEIQKKGNVTFYLTTMGISFALKHNIDVDSFLDVGFKVRAFSHKPPKVPGIEDYELEAALVARELDAFLLTTDEKVKQKKGELGVKLIDLESLLGSS